MDDRVIDSPVPKLDVQALIAQATAAAMEAAMLQLSYAEPEETADVDGPQQVIHSVHGDVLWQAVDDVDEEHEDEEHGDRVIDEWLDKRVGRGKPLGPELVVKRGPNGQTELVRAPEISASSVVE
jgi:hypothetical protein